MQVYEGTSVSTTKPVIPRNALLVRKAVTLDSVRLLEYRSKRASSTFQRQGETPFTERRRAITKCKERFNFRPMQPCLLTETSFRFLFFHSQFTTIYDERFHKHRADRNRYVSNRNIAGSNAIHVRKKGNKNDSTNHRPTIITRTFLSLPFRRLRTARRPVSPVERRVRDRAGTSVINPSRRAEHVVHSTHLTVKLSKRVHTA